MLLLAEGAAWWERTRTVIAADTHFGKAEHFRSLGVPVPCGTSEGSLQLLMDVVRRFGAQRVIVLGDLLHADGPGNNQIGDMLSAIFEANPNVEMMVIRGNHDVTAGDLPVMRNLKYVDELVDGALEFRHMPSERVKGFEMAGHIHPVVSMWSETGSRVRAKCFWVGPRQIVLPAFGKFTGGAAIQAREGDRVFAIGDGEIEEVPSVVKTRRKRVGAE
ncbi:MAG TPA: ligase-associated DNA damage response endonuclease PdeM [Phycisphaerales bacterium]|nr:ligase-associated DNA damage response endonuclease PdeM [Phycisphaerales bacterium]